MSFTLLRNDRWRSPGARTLPELLHTQGLLGWKEQSSWESHPGPVILLPACRLSREQEGILVDLVAGGATLIACRPPLSLAWVFGLQPTGRILEHGYLRFTRQEILPEEMQGLVLQCPSAMDLYLLEGAQALAWRCDPLEGDEHYPAVVAHRHGQGHAIALAFDVADTVLRLHQGNRLRASDQPEQRPDGLDWPKPNDLLLGELDTRLRLIPQADAYQRLLLCLLENACAVAGQPLLRLWHYPQGASALATFTGDSDGMTRGHFDEIRSIIEAQGGCYTLYLMEEHRDQISPADADALRRAGHGLSHHTWVEFNPTIEAMRVGVRRQLDGFKERYGFQPLSQRGHCCIWVGWVEQAKILSENGIRLDGNHYPYVHHQYGFLSGSGQPFRFFDEQGAPLDLWEQPTLTSDDCMLQDKTFLPPFTMEETIQRTRELIDLVMRWHGVYHPCFHPIYMHREWVYPYTGPWVEAAAAYCHERGVPMVSAEEWARFMLARRSVRLRNQEQKEGRLTLALQSDEPVSGLALMLPERFARAASDRTPLPVRTACLEGRQRALALLNLPAGKMVEITLTEAEVESDLLPGEVTP